MAKVSTTPPLLVRSSRAWRLWRELTLAPSSRAFANVIPHLCFVIYRYMPRLPNRTLGLALRGMKRSDLRSSRRWSGILTPAYAFGCRAFSCPGGSLDKWMADGHVCQTRPMRAIRALTILKLYLFSDVEFRFIQLCPLA